MDAISPLGGIKFNQTREFTESSPGGLSQFAEGDVLVAKITPCFENGKCALAEFVPGGYAAGTTELHVLRPATRILPRLLFYVCTSSTFRDAGQAHMTGAAGQKRVPPEFVANYRFALPDHDAQRAIIDFLDRETGKIDDLIAKKQRLLELLEEKRAALLNQITTKGLDPASPLKPTSVPGLSAIPAHWELRRLAMAADKLTNGYVGPTRDIFYSSGVKYLQSLHIKRNTIVFDPEYYVSSEWHHEHAKSRLRAADVLIVQTGDIGQVAVVPANFGEANCHALIIVSPKPCILGQYLAWLLNSTYGLNSLLTMRTGALHPHLNCSNVRDIVLPLPPLVEQQAIAAELTTLDQKNTYTVAKIEEMISLLREYRSALITAAVTGQLDIPRHEEQMEVLAS
jgi:type I restriction enzyme, S subunit